MRQFKKHRKVRNARLMKDSNNDFSCDEEEVKKGRANPDFIKRHSLSENSDPADWFKVLLSNRADKTTKH